MPELADLTWPKRTARLTLRPTVEVDLPALWQIRRLEQVGLWMTDLSTDFDDFAARLREPDKLAVTITVERDGQVIGDLMLRREDLYAQGEVKDRAVRASAEIGWSLDPAEGGQGYATEAAAELVRIAFDELGLHRVTALCFADNEPSWRLMERLGMRREGHYVRDSLHRDRGWVDGLAYALLAEEWAARPR
ncbi:MAG: GNAT family protein [Propionibacteriales bacterium]|nr:GNAT family protein [Propionibacteriales bacterium]